MPDPLLQIKEDIGELRGEIKGMREAQDDHFTSIQNQFNSQFTLLARHQKDINDEQLWRAGIMGRVSVITLIVGGAWTLVLTFGKTILDKLLR